ncbi:hypothetical protein TSUD_408920 [Trifolium subterraneum]|uniref:RNase H type-1 domain-containing protein n=1 Tax=Trifolium subterraneum TaxID=3900 RepID=A0A2Z6PS44_TRISU|nr:hypothetical protein TSUD_408920 [Trifolium subterraneum]
MHMKSQARKVTDELNSRCHTAAQCHCPPRLIAVCAAGFCTCVHLQSTTTSKIPSAAVEGIAPQREAEEKIRDRYEAERILETPLVSSVREDKVIWEEEKNGCYLVKSGYKLAMRYIIRSNKYHVAGNWNGIWTVKPRTRHTIYFVRDEEIEDELHIFFKCVVARESWCAAGLSSVLHNTAYQQSNVMYRIFVVCSSGSSDTVGEWLCYSGAFGTIVMISFGMTMSRCHAKLEDMLLMHGMIALGWVKCNIDVAFVCGSGKTLVGLCFRDNNGQFMAGMTQWQQTVVSSVEGEARALLLAMEEARHRGLDRVQFESDSKVLIDAIHMKCRGNSEFLSIVHDILSFMSSFLNFEVKFVRRQANSVAHTLARAANSWTNFHRFENIPFCIEHLIVNEMQ